MIVGWFIHSFIPNSCNHSHFMHSFLSRDFIPSSFIHAFIHSFTHSFTHARTHSRTHALTHPVIFNSLQLIATTKVFLGRKKVVPTSDSTVGHQQSSSSSSSKRLYAIKIMKKEDLIGRNMQNHVKAERDALAKTHSPFVVKLYYSLQVRRWSCHFVFSVCLSAEEEGDGHCPSFSPSVRGLRRTDMAVNRFATKKLYYLSHLH